MAFEKNSALFRDSRRGLGEFLQAGAIAEEEVENRMLAGVDNLNLVPVSFYPYMYAAPLRIGIGSHHNNHHRPIIPPKVLQDSEPRPYSSDGTSFAEEEEKINDEMHDRLEVPRGARHGSKRWRKREVEHDSLLSSVRGERIGVFIVGSRLLRGSVREIWLQSCNTGNWKIS
ncbi:hypothetical protein IMZ48_41750 [Candidatus Bathyarchaeota archaeon]|nr:hypothetical protein [Candidatus Bathyarchaeota archaeon]